MSLLLSSAGPLAKSMFREMRGRLSRASFRSSSDRGSERYRRASLTTVASLIQKLLTVVISLVSVPLTVHYLGHERYGVWLTISSLLVWIAISDFGLAGNALLNVLSQADGNDDRISAQEYASSAVWALSAVAAVFAIAVIASLPFISWSAVFHVSAVPHRELNLACALTLGFFVISLPLSVQYSIYSAYQDGFLSNICGMAMNVSSLIALVIVTRFHGGLPELVLALSGTRTALAFVNCYYMFFIRYRWLMPVPSAVRWYCVQRLFKLGTKYLLVHLGSLGMYQSQPMIITQILGPSAVVIFVVAQKIVTLPMDVIFLATAPFVPAFGEAKARNDWKWIRGAFRKLTLISVAVGLPILLTIALSAKWLIRIWAGAAAVPDTSLILWLSLYNLLGVTLMATGQLLTGVERVNPLALSIVLTAIAIIGFGIVACYSFGLSGVAMAMALCKLTIFWPIQLWAVRRVFSTDKIDPLEATSEVAA
jgi:O-antigen/teichoic acid export membrane protein